MGCDTEYNITQIIYSNRKIVLDSYPSGAKIFLNNVNTNKITPDSLLNLDYGSHTIKFELANHYDTLFSISVENENRLVYSIEMWPTNTGNLVITSTPPAAQIFLDNLFMNKITPDTLKYISAGPHTITLRKETLPDTTFTTDISPKTYYYVFITLNDIPLSNISFGEYIKPILQVKCSFSGCHSGQSPADGIDLTTWAGVTADPNIVFPGEPDLSRLVWVIENKPGVPPMPPIGYTSPLTLNQIRAIRTWIDEGALNN